MLVFLTSVIVSYFQNPIIYLFLCACSKDIQTMMYGAATDKFILVVNNQYKTLIKHNLLHGLESFFMRFCFLVL